MALAPNCARTTVIAAISMLLLATPGCRTPWLAPREQNEQFSDADSYTQSGEQFLSRSDDARNGTGAAGYELARGTRSQTSTSGERIHRSLAQRLRSGNRSSSQDNAQRGTKINREQPNDDADMYAGDADSMSAEEKAAIERFAALQVLKQEQMRRSNAKRATQPENSDRQMLSASRSRLDESNTDERDYSDTLDDPAIAFSMSDMAPETAEPEELALEFQESRRPISDSSPSRSRVDAGVVTASFEEQTDSETYLAPIEQVQTMPLAELAEAMQEKLRAVDERSLTQDQRIELEKQKRLISLALGDLAAAQEPIDGLASEAQAYVRETLQSLHEATDIHGNPAASRRLTQALETHRRAAKSLADAANLQIHNLAFCTEVDSFGVVKEFPSYEFREDQEVLLYCELENFVSKRVRDGYETRLQGNYEIVDANGRRIAEQILPEDTDVCGNQRRDFYIAYHLHMPRQIKPGDYRLKLIIEDMQGHKFGQANIEFRIAR